MSAARNTGIDWVFENSDSQWITFVDSDDALNSKCLMELYRVAMETGADIVSTYIEFFENESELARAGEYVGPVTTMSGQEACLELYRSGETVTINATGKLFATGLLNRLRFPVGKIHEDQNLVPQIVYGAKKISCLRSWLYYYRQTPGSITHASFSIKRFDDIDALNTCIDFFGKHRENEIVLLAKRHRNQLQARMTFTARQEGIYDQVPEQYRMGIIRAGAIIFAGTFRSGGINFVLKRIRNLIGQVTKNV